MIGKAIKMKGISSIVTFLVPFLLSKYSGSKKEKKNSVKNMRGGSGNQEDETQAQTILNLDHQIPDFGSKSFMEIFKNEDLAKDFLEKIMDINFPNKEATISELELGLKKEDLLNDEKRKIY